MDISGVDYSEDKYNSVVTEVSNLLKTAGFNPDDVPMIAGSSFLGENIFNALFSGKKVQKREREVVEKALESLSPFLSKS